MQDNHNFIIDNLQEKKQHTVILTRPQILKISVYIYKITIAILKV